MPSKRTPAERGYKQVLLNPRAAQAFEAYCTANGGLSASAAILKLTTEGVSIPPTTAVESVSIHPTFTPDDLERMFLACRVTDRRQMQVIREWFATFFGWEGHYV